MRLLLKLVFMYVLIQLVKFGINILIGQFPKRRKVYRKHFCCRVDKLNDTFLPESYFADCDRIVDNVREEGKQII